jgi:hypothetical protein
VKSYNELTNFCVVEEYSDETQLNGIEKENGGIESKFKDLLMSELFELKNMWYLYNKKINSLLVILP